MADSETNEPSTASGPRSGVPGLLKALVAVLTAVLIAVAVLGFLLMEDDDEAEGTEAEAALINKSAYQTVFLTNGQVYFGKLETIEADFYKLTDIFYLQVQQAVQPTGASSNSNANTQTTTPADPSQTQLVKLGDELHAPEDSMQINRDQVQFWENIKNDGKVAQAIAEYKKK